MSVNEWGVSPNVGYNRTLLGETGCGKYSEEIQTGGLLLNITPEEEKRTGTETIWKGDVKENHEGILEDEKHRKGENETEQPTVNTVYRNQIGANPKGNIQRECV